MLTRLKLVCVCVCVCVCVHDLSPTSKSLYLLWWWVLLEYGQLKKKLRGEDTRTRSENSALVCDSEEKTILMKFHKR